MTSEQIAERCEGDIFMKKPYTEKMVSPTNRHYPHGIVSYRFRNEKTILDFQERLAKFWTSNTTDMVVLPIL